MKSKLAKLIDVKSIVTLCLTLVFCVLSLLGEVPQEFLAIYTMIIGFYFGTQATKREEPVSAVYVGPQQSESVDAATAHATHPPEQESGSSDVVVNGFAG